MWFGELYIPKDTDITNLLWYLPVCEKLTGFTLDPDCNNFQIKDGVLFINNYLIKYPSGKTDKEYTIPDDTVGLLNFEFSLPMFYKTVNLERINVNENNSLFSSVGGCLFDKEISVLHACPSGIKKVDLPSTVKTVMNAAFSGDRLEEIRFQSGTVLTLDVSTFVDCSSLKKIVIEEGADISFNLDSIIFHDTDEHTIYVIAPEGFTLDTTGYSSIINIEYGEPPSDSNTFPLTYVVIGAIVILALTGGAIIVKKRKA